MRALHPCLLALLAVGCGEAPTSSVGATAPVQSNVASSSAQPSASTPAPRSISTERTGELVNPDDTTMVLLYFDLAGLPAPIEQSLEDDPRVRMARPTEKPAQRDAVRRQLEAGLAGVRGVGAILLPMRADLSEYDATYSEFTVRALAPSSMVEYRALGQKVALKFGNARTAQVWRVPAPEARAVRDRLGYSGDVSLDALLAVRDVHAAPEGGTVTVDVVEYELRETRGGTLLGRVHLAP
jgi:hypothetical protein